MLNTIIPIYPDLSVGGNTDHTGSLSRWHSSVRRDLQQKKGWLQNKSSGPGRNYTFYTV